MQNIPVLLGCFGTLGVQQRNMSCFQDFCIDLASRQELLSAQKLSVLNAEKALMHHKHSTSVSSRHCCQYLCILCASGRKGTNTSIEC